MCQTGFAEMDVTVNHTGQKGFAFGINDDISGGANFTVNPVNPSVADENIGGSIDAFVYHLGVFDENGTGYGLLSAHNPNIADFIHSSFH